MNRVVNWYGFAAGVLTVVVLVISLFIPWWQLTVGDNLMKVNASPLTRTLGYSAPISRCRCSMHSTS